MLPIKFSKASMIFAVIKLLIISTGVFSTAIASNAIVTELDETTTAQISLPQPQEQEFKRIVSAGGSITEIVYALGLMDQVIAVDSSSLFPAIATSLPQVGYFRSLSSEGVLSLKPDLLIAARGAGPAQVLDQISSTGVKVKQFEQSIYTLESWKELVMEIGHFFNSTKAANALVQQAIANIKLHQKSMNYELRQLNGIALLNSGQRGPTAAGRNTMPDLLFELSGIHNLAAGIDGYKPFSPEMLATQNIDLILVPHHTIESMGGREGVCKQQAIKYATQEGCNVQVMDALLLLGFGARIDEAVKGLIDQGNQI